MQECKTRKQLRHTPSTAESGFRSMLDNPFALGLSFYMYHNFRSQKLLSLLSRCCAGVGYDHVTSICNKIAMAVNQNIKEYGVYVPPGLMKNKSIRASMDNIDKKVDTPDGKGSFHGMALGIYQSSGHGETVVTPLNIGNIGLTSEGLKDVPPSCINLVTCSIDGSPKPRTSPHYDNYKIGVYDKVFATSQMNDFVWMLVRFFNREPFASSSNVSEASTESFPRSDEKARSVQSSQSEETEENLSDRLEGKQRIHLWSAYNSLVHLPTSADGEPLVDKAYALPIINAPAHDWSTLLTGLDQLTKLNSIVSGPDRKVVVTLDMDLYKRTLKIEYLDPKYKNKWILCPGAFHTVVCALRCLGRTVEGSGLDQAWQEADLYSGVTVTQIINGNHHNRALEAHLITLQALFDLWMETFLDSHPTIKATLQSAAKELSDACQAKNNLVKTHQAFLAKVDSLNVGQLLEDYDATRDKDPMYKWIRMYMRQVMTLLQFQRATREGNWFLYLSSLEHLCVYFFAFDRLDYAQNMPEYIARMQDLESTEPEIWQEFVNGDFTVNSSNTVPFTRIGVDHAMEHLNKCTKGQGGISGITSSPSTLLKYCLTAPELARLASETEQLVEVINSNTVLQHHCLSQAKVTRQEKAIRQLKEVLASSHLFRREYESSPNINSNHMIKIVSNEIIADDVQESILCTEQKGQEAYQKFVEERLIGDGNLWDRMTKVKLKTWTAAARNIKLKVGSENMTLKATTSLFARLLVIARSSREDVDLAKVIGIHEFAYTNNILMQPSGCLHPTNDKSMVIHLLKDLVHTNSNAEPTATHMEYEKLRCLVVDGMAVVQELMASKRFSTCKDFGISYVKLIGSRAKGYDQVRVIFDNYTKVSSLKEATRERRRAKAKVVKSYVVEDSTQIKDQKSFLASNSTKASLTVYLAQKLIVSSNIEKLMTATHASVQTNFEVDSTQDASSQEEADTLMILHAVSASAAGYEVHIYSQDTDVLLLALRRAPQLGKGAAMIMGTGERRQKVMLEPIYDQLGPEKSAAVINWHSLTGCDTTGHIYGKGKKGCFTAFLDANSRVIQAITNLGIGEEPSEDVVSGCEEFLCTLFCPKGQNITTARDLRWHLFKRLKSDQAINKLPPTHGAWKEHIKRAHLQANIWQQDLVLHPVIPDPLKLGWKEENERLIPILSLVAPAPDSVLQLVKCNCGATNFKSTTKCSGRCSCKLNNLVCTELCACEGDDETCTNTEPPVIGEDTEENF